MISTKEKILLYLKFGGLISGTQLELQSRLWETKPSTISRRCRELAEDGKIDRLVGPSGTVQYRLAENRLDI